MRRFATVLVLVLMMPCIVHASSASEKKAKSVACLEELRIVDRYSRNTLTPMMYDENCVGECAQDLETFYTLSLHRVSGILEECRNHSNDNYVDNVLLALRNIGIISRRPIDKRSSPQPPPNHQPPPSPGQ